jgi:hypothetical protein
VGRGEEVERELQVHQRAGVASEPDLASGHRMPGVEVPQLKGDDAAGPSAGEPEPAAGFVGAGGQSENKLKGPGHRLRGRCVSRRQPQRERIQQDIHHPRRPGTGGRSAGGPGRLQHTGGAVQITGPHRRGERLQVRLTRGADIERLQAPGCAEHQPRSVADTSLVKGDLPAQVLHLGGPQRVRRPGLDRDQQPECLI